MKIDPNELIANFRRSRLGTTLPRDDTTTAAATSGALNVGSSTYRWLDLYCKKLYVASDTTFHSLDMKGSITGTVYVSNELRLGSSYTITTGEAKTGGRFDDGTKFWRTYGYVFINPSSGGVSTEWAHGITDPENQVVAAWAVQVGASSSAISAPVGPPNDPASSSSLHVVVRQTGTAVVDYTPYDTVSQTQTFYLFVDYKE